MKFRWMGQGRASEGYATGKGYFLLPHTLNLKLGCVSEQGSGEHGIAGVRRQKAEGLG